MEIVERVVVTTLVGGSVTPQRIVGRFGQGRFANQIDNAACIVPAWTNITSEASALIVMQRRNSNTHTWWELSGGLLDHFPFSGLAYSDAFWGSRWINGVAAPTGAAFTDPVAIVVSVRDGQQRAFWNGRLWVSATATGAFTLAANLQAYTQGDAGTDHYLFGAWDRALTDSEASTASENPWQLFRAPRPIIYSLPASGTPTLSAATVIDIGTTSVRPRVTITI